MSPDTCKHYNGDHRNEQCKCGVKYRDVTSEPDRRFGIAFRKPCVNWVEFHKLHGEKMSAQQLAEWEKRGKCDKFELPTQDEIRKYDEEVQGHVVKYTIARAAILKDLDERHKSGDKSVSFSKHSQGIQDGGEPSNFLSGAGSIDCPACKTGKLSYRRSSYNGHVHAACSTSGCVRWME